jgi:hypothetical protein
MYLFLLDIRVLLQVATAGCYLSARLTAETTALSDEVTIEESIPTPQSVFPLTVHSK